MFAIRIHEGSLELIAALNNGVKPLVQLPNEYFVYTDHDTPSVILSKDDFVAISDMNDLISTTYSVWQF